jgi:hypothetical protein
MIQFHFIPRFTTLNKKVFEMCMSFPFLTAKGDPTILHHLNIGVVTNPPNKNFMKGAFGRSQPIGFALVEQILG